MVTTTRKPAVRKAPVRRKPAVKKDPNVMKGMRATNTMTSEQYRKVVKPFTSEKRFQQSVINLAKTFGWRVFFTYRSKNSPPGEPDLRMVRGNRYVLMELKTDVGVLSAHQVEVRAILQECAAVEYYLLRYVDWTSGKIENILR